MKLFNVVEKERNTSIFISNIAVFVGGSGV